MRRHQFHSESHSHLRGPDGHGGGRHRARRGALTLAILTLLNERPMHGYELITELEARSGGRWKPSPGAIYPALGKLEYRGMVTSTEIDGRRDYSLTDAGRQVAENLATHGGSAPWAETELDGHGDLRRALAELDGPARQIGRFGTPAQREVALATIKDATARLYKVLADGDTPQ